MKQVTAVSPASELIAYYGGPASGVYFQRAQKTLAGARVAAVVAMDFFASRPGILCGVAEAIRLLGGILQKGDEAWAIAEGETMSQKETVLRIRAPYSRFGVYETALLGMLSSCSGWATAAREIVDAACGWRLRASAGESPSTWSKRSAPGSTRPDSDMSGSSSRGAWTRAGSASSKPRRAPSILMVSGWRSAPRRRSRSPPTSRRSRASR